MPSTSSGPRSSGRTPRSRAFRTRQTVAVLPIPARPTDRHQPFRLVFQEVTDQLRLDVAVLEVARREGRRRVEELWCEGCPRPVAPAAAPAPGPARCSPRFASSLLRGRRRSAAGLRSPPPTGRYRSGLATPDRNPPRGGGRVSRPPGDLPSAEPALGLFEPLQVVPQLGQGLVERSGEVDVLAAIQPERRDGFPIVGEEHDRLLESQRPGPLALANRVVLHAVDRHHEQQARTIADRLVDLRIPIPVGLNILLVEPGRDVGRSPFQRIVELEGEVSRIGPGITDEVVTVHRFTDFGTGPGPRTPVGFIKCIAMFGRLQGRRELERSGQSRSYRKNDTDDAFHVGIRRSRGRIG